MLGGVELTEITVAEAHRAMEAGTLTARMLVEAYFERIAAYDSRGPPSTASSC